MSPAYAITAVVVVSLATLIVGVWGFRVARTTSDFFVASRSVGASLNASAIGGEYLSAASFLGVAGLLLVSGADMLWYPVGWTGGYLVLMVLVAAPLRRSGAYTLPDFAEARLQSRWVRLVCSLLVVTIGWLYLIPQFQGANLVLGPFMGARPWMAGVVVAGVVLANVLVGGMRSITLVQAFQYWLKLTALLVPIIFLLIVWSHGGAPSPVDTPAIGGVDGPEWASPMTSSSEHPLYLTWSIIFATTLGTMGLPHVVVRFYTNPDGRAARRTTLAVLVLLAVFYVLPPIYGSLGRIYAPDLIASGRADAVVLELPLRMIGGVGGELLSALLLGGAFAAFLSTSSGLTVALAGVLSQDVISKRIHPIRAFRLAAIVAVVVPLLLSIGLRDVSLARTVGLAFAVAASTFCPLLLLGIWWRGLTDIGALAGLAVGGWTSLIAVVNSMIGGKQTGWAADLLGQPALWTVPLAFATMVVISLLTKSRIHPSVNRFMVRLHTPESLRVDRGPASNSGRLT